MLSFLETEIGASRIMRVFAALSAINTKDPRPLLQPRTVQRLETLTFESDHPYRDNQDFFKTIEIAGAETLTIVFDEKSATEENCDTVAFYADKTRRDQFGSTYSGGAGNWPGVGGKPPLVIHGSTACMRFLSDSSGNVSVTFCSPVALHPPPLPTALAQDVIFCIII